MDTFIIFQKNTMLICNNCLCIIAFFLLLETQKILIYTTTAKLLKANPAGIIYRLKVNKRNTRIRCEICSKLTIKIPERCHWRRSGIFIVNFKHISHIVLVLLLLTLNMHLSTGNKLKNCRILLLKRFYYLLMVS